MQFPVVPVVSAVAAALGLYGLYWYHTLSKAEQQQADELAANYARQLYNKQVAELKCGERNHVMNLVRAAIGS